MKILIAEDERDIRMLLHDQLTGAGYTVAMAADGEEALKLFNSDDIDMAIFDIMMPKMDGLSLLAKIRETSEMPVILLTARGEEIDKVSGLRLGADDYLVKPWGMNELLARIEVQKRHIRSAAESSEVIVSGNLRMDFGTALLRRTVR